MNIDTFYKKSKIEKALHVSVRASVPAYLYIFHRFFFVFPDKKRTFFDKKNTSFGLSY